MANSLTGKGLETTEARQAHYIVWANTSGMKDPCGPEVGWELIVTKYAKYVMLGVNYKNKSTVRSATVRGYLEAVNDFFNLRGFPILANFADPENMAVTIFNNLEREMKMWPARESH